MNAVKSLPPERLAEPHSLAIMQPMRPTLGDLLLQVLAGHDGLHVGQLSDGEWANPVKPGRRFRRPLAN